MNGSIDEKTDLDKLLVEKAQAGDIEAFETLIKQYEKKVYNISYRLLSDKDDAMDAAQDVFIKVFRSIRNFKSEARFSTWIYRITSNVCFDILRKRKNRNVISIDADIAVDDGVISIEQADTAQSVEESIEREELKLLVSEAVKELSEKHRVMIVLRDFQDLSYSDIALILDCPEGTIKSRVNRARKALRDLIIRKKELEGYIFRQKA